MEISSASIDIWTIGLIAAGVVAGVTLIAGIICLSFLLGGKGTATSAACDRHRRYARTNGGRRLANSAWRRSWRNTSLNRQAFDETST